MKEVKNSKWNTPAMKQMRNAAWGEATCRQIMSVIRRPAKHLAEMETINAAERKRRRKQERNLKRMVAA
jgi:hypothetical protein